MLTFFNFLLIFGEKVFICRFFSKLKSWHLFRDWFPRFPIFGQKCFKELFQLARYIKSLLFHPMKWKNPSAQKWEAAKESPYLIWQKMKLCDLWRCKTMLWTYEKNMVWTTQKIFIHKDITILRFNWIVTGCLDFFSRKKLQSRMRKRKHRQTQHHFSKQIRTAWILHFWAVILSFEFQTEP